MDITDRRSFGRNLKVRGADCVDRQHAPPCQRCGQNKSTVGTIDKKTGVAESLCGGCLDEDLTVVVDYI